MKASNLMLLPASSSIASAVKVAAVVLVVRVDCVAAVAVDELECGEMEVEALTDEPG